MDDDDVEVTHDFCVRKAARTLQALYANDVSDQQFENSMHVVDRWIQLAQEIRLKEDDDLRRFDAIRQQHQPS